MKRFIICLVLGSCLLVSFTIPVAAAPADDPELPGPGMTPDSPFYFLDGWSKTISLFFTFGDETRAEKALGYAGERLSEALFMQKEEHPGGIQKAMDGYRHYLDEVNLRLCSTVNSPMSAEALESIAVMSRLYYAALIELPDDMPGGAAGMENIRNLTAETQFRALSALAETDIEIALELAAESVGYLLEKTHQAATHNDREVSVTGLDLLVSLEDSLLARVLEQNRDAAAHCQDVVLSAENRLGLLSALHADAGESQRPAIVSMIVSSYSSYVWAAE